MTKSRLIPLHQRLFHATTPFNLTLHLLILVSCLSVFGQDRPLIGGQVFALASDDEISAGMAATAMSMGVSANEYEIFELNDAEPIRVLRAQMDGQTVMVFHIVATGEEVYATITSAPETAEMRMWDSGSEELIFSARGVERRTKPESDGSGRELRVAPDSDVSDALACIARSAGLDFSGMSRSNLSSSISRAACSGSNSLALFLTAASCLSIPPSPMSLTGCVAGVVQLLSCGIANCAVQSCDVASLSIGDSVGGQFQSSCRSTHRTGSYAKFYKFRVSRSSTVTIDLASSIDTYLFLLEGDGTSGRLVDSDDDGGTGTNSRIRRTLGPGTYTIEATTYSSRSTGSFSLAIR